MKKSIKITIAVLMLGLYLVSMISLASALLIEGVSMNPNEIAPGETSKITIEIENDGDIDIEDVSINLMLIDPTGFVDVPFAPFDSSSEVGFDEIKEGKSKTAEFEIIALNSAKSGIYKIPLHITYREDSEVKTKDSLISVIVNSEPILGVSVEDGLFLKQQENEVDVKVINKGLSDIRFLDVRIKESVYFDLLSAEEIYIGDIDSDDFDSVEFKIYFKKNSQEEINLPIEISYKDAMNNEYTENFVLPVKVYTRDKAIELGLIEQSRTGLYIGIVVGLFVIYMIYKRIKKSRLKRKAGASA